MMEIETLTTEEEGDTIESKAYQQLKRLQSDFVNYKRRVENENDERTKMANEELIKAILPVLDNFDRALENVPDENKDEEWVKGMNLIYQQLESILEKEGLSQIEALGEEFDPQKHEAVFTEKGDIDKQETVSSVMRKGYRLHDKVIRPAQVSVIKGTKPEQRPVSATVTRKNVPIRRGGDVRWRQSRFVPNAGEMFF